MSNFDTSELAKFSSLAAQWWDETGELRTLHQVNPLRLRYIMEKTSLKNKRIIDVGCGGGILTESMAKQGAHVTGIDLNKSLLEVAKLHQLEAKTNVDYLKISAEEMAIQHPHTYDVVTCLELLEHVPDPAAIVKACAKLAKPQGHIFFSTLNRNPKSYLFAILGAEYLLKLLPKNTHDYAKFIRPAELHAWASAADLSPKEVMGIHYNPFSKAFTLTHDINVNYLFYANS